MSSTGVGADTATEVPKAGTVDMKLEVVTLPVSDVERASAFTRAWAGAPTSSPARTSVWSS
jgi:hypothetical protein